MTITTENLIELKPTDDMEYWLELSEMFKYDNLSKEEGRKLLEYYGKYFWDIYDNGVRVAVIGCQYVPGLHWTIDGYTDPRLDRTVKRKINVAVDSMVMVRDFLFSQKIDVIRSTHHRDNRAASRICKKCGFVFIMDIDSPIGPYKVFETRRR